MKILAENNSEPTIPLTKAESELVSEAVGEWIHNRYSTSPKKDKMLDLQEKIREYDWNKPNNP